MLPPSHEFLDFQKCQHASHDFIAPPLSIRSKIEPTESDRGTTEKRRNHRRDNDHGQSRPVDLLHFEQ
jgi:hypothetical protein